MIFCSRLTIDRWLKRFEPQGTEGLAERKRDAPFAFGLGWVAVLVVWVTKHTPRDFGFRRSRWACTALARLLRKRHDVSVSRETARRWLHRGNLVYSRPRPVVGPTDPEREAKMAALRRLVAGLPADETIVGQDEVVESLWKWEGRIEVHLLLLYAPETNPIERVWWRLHEPITRNHRCRDLRELLGLVFAWLESEGPFTDLTHHYH